MASRAEERISRSLRKALALLPEGAELPDSPEFSDVLLGLEYFIPPILAAIYPEWKHEGLDGFLPLVARKNGNLSAMIYGLCILIIDQTTTPINV